MPATDPKPLDGVRVLEFAQLFPGPYAGLVLRELGAEVLKVEPPTGDPTRMVPPFLEDSGGGAGAIFCALNRGKRSIQLDLKADDENPQERYKQLADSARIVLDGYGAGVADRLGIGYDTLTQNRDDLIYITLTGFGTKGPLVTEPGHDVTYQAWMGTIDPDDPELPNLPTADASSGLWAALMATSHLNAEGNHKLDTSLAGSLNAANLMQNALTIAGRDANPLTGGLPGYGIYECREGKPLAVGALEPAFWRNLARATGDPDLAELGDPTNPKDLDEARNRLIAHFQRQPREAWLTRLREIGVPCAPVRGVQEAIEKPLELASIDPPGAWTREDLMGAPSLGEANDALLD